MGRVRSKSHARPAQMPFPALGTAAVPPASVPIRLPWILTVAHAVVKQTGEKWIPSEALPEMTLPGGIPGCDVGPPMVPEKTDTLVPFDSANVPVASMPMKLPWTRLRPKTPGPLLPEITLRCDTRIPPIWPCQKTTLTSTSFVRPKCCW